MARGSDIDRKTYNKLVAGFREQPGVYRHAARVANCSVDRAKRGWELGWPKHEWAIPIKDVIDRERNGVRAARAEIVDSPILAARDLPAVRETLVALVEHDRTRAAKEEAMLVTMIRRSSLRVEDRLARVEPVVDRILDDLAKLVKASPNGLYDEALLGPDEAPPEGKVSIQTALDILKMLATWGKLNADRAKLVFDLERQLLGDPKAKRDRPFEGRPSEEAWAVLEAMVSDRLAVREGRPRVLEGGRE